MSRKKRKVKPIPVKQDDPERRRQIRRITAQFLAAVLLVGGCGIGFHYLKRHVERQVFPAEPPRVVLVNRPVWMSDFLAGQIAEMARPRVPRSPYDHQMLIDSTEMLRVNPWIRQVRQIRRVYDRGPGDVLEIDCEYRAPVAMVQWGNYLWLVDGEGVKLPEQFTLEQAPRIIYGRNRQTNIRIITGVRRPPPESGQKWIGEDLAAGLDLVKLLHGRPYTEEIVKVDVSNFRGRDNPREAELVLVTKYYTEVRWGRPIRPRDIVEVSPAQKLEYIRQVYEEFGRVDGNYPWIDIRFDVVTHPDNRRASHASGS